MVVIIIHSSSIITALPHFNKSVRRRIITRIPFGSWQIKNGIKFKNTLVPPLFLLPTQSTTQNIKKVLRIANRKSHIAQRISSIFYLSSVLHILNFGGIMPTLFTDPRSGGVKKSSGVNVLPLVKESE